MITSVCAHRVPSDRDSPGQISNLSTRSVKPSIFASRTHARLVKERSRKLAKSFVAPLWTHTRGALFGLKTRPALDTRLSNEPPPNSTLAFVSAVSNLRKRSSSDQVCFRVSLSLARSPTPRLCRHVGRRNGSHVVALMSIR